MQKERNRKQNITRSLIVNQCIKSLPIFKKKAAGIPWQERSILMSEAFAFCAVCDLCDIDIIIESGIWLGRSTEIWANYFLSKSIYAIDSKLKELVIRRLKKYNNVTLIEGDSYKILKRLSADFKTQKIGVFIDGPKGPNALRLGLDILRQQNIEFCAFHDVYKMKNGRQKEIRRLFENLNLPTFFTDEKWFVEKYAELDKNESHWDNVQDLRWIPYKFLSKDGKCDRILGSYGATIGFAF